MSLRRRMLLPGVALEQALHDHEGSYPRNGGKSLRDHGKAMKTRPALRFPAETGTSRARKRAGWLTADHQVINRRVQAGHGHKALMMASASQRSYRPSGQPWDRTSRS